MGERTTITLEPDVVERLRAEAHRTGRSFKDVVNRAIRAGLEIVEDGGVRGDLVMDAHLAALAREHGATIVSTDRDFRRFRGVRLIDPSLA